ncbi:MAG: DUF2798 domain-containing protein [Gallionella sp.]|nr:DUF2798 domain-containing protein [Gallionella sp.]
MRIAPRYAPQLFALLMSLVMAFIMTAFVTWVNTGLTDGYLPRWGHAFITAWPVALICVLLFAGRIRALVGKLTSE